MPCSLRTREAGCFLLVGRMTGSTLAILYSFGCLGFPARILFSSANTGKVLVIESKNTLASFEDGPCKAAKVT